MIVIITVDIIIVATKIQEMLNKQASSPSDHLSNSKLMINIAINYTEGQLYLLCQG